MTEKLTIKAIKDRLVSADLTAAELASFRQDERKGVISALNSYDKKQARLAQKQLEFEKRLEIERLHYGFTWKHSIRSGIKRS